jgi:hypothetical protein
MNVKRRRFPLIYQCGAQGRNRTTDTVIFSHVLYQLSYLGAARGVRTRRAVYRGSVGRCPERAMGNGPRGAGAASAG